MDIRAGKVHDNNTFYMLVLFSYSRMRIQIWKSAGGVEEFDLEVVTEEGLDVLKYQIISLTVS